MVEYLYHNKYQCPNCGAEWEDDWDCGVDDECPECDTRDISPYESTEIDGDEV